LLSNNGVSSPDRHFRFSVASKLVGFSICELKCIISKHFDVYFHLWRDGGANWFREWNKWQEESATWQVVHSHKRRGSSLSSKRVSFAKKLIQACLIHKDPKETIFFGDIHCNLDLSVKNSFGRAPNSN
jgi:hypothetical protein